MKIRSNHPFLKAGLIALAWGLGGTPVHAASVGPLTGDTDYQVPYVQAWSAFSGSFMADYADQLGALAAAPSADTWLAAASGLRVQYVGTDSASTASLLFGADQQALFDTRAGCSYAQWQGDPFCLIEQIGQTREIAGLGSTEPLQFALRVEGQTSGTGSDAHLLELGGGRWLLGFEDNGDGNYADAVFLLAPFDAVAVVPEPAAWMLAAAGLACVAAQRRRSRPSAL